MKLIKLVLSGFKSFADKTEFDFDKGISCIVGPNGCGKSNVVDAVKWVLGEQSAKSLRGSEMMDVVFNGSSARKAAGGAEVTLVFDNDDGLLRPQGDQGPPSATVAITRRLFRSGQSDYRINKTPCRLRDIKEMFMDTGNAYSLIEQGRVEGFLQASQEDRRSIFDEAAGISKYKARKKEAQRKLERVEQNLLRVHDILEEVEKRLRSIKYQAGKARNYQAYSERLKDLRSLHVLARYHELSAQRAELQKLVDAGNDALAQAGARIDQLETAASGTEIESVDLERTSRELQGRIAAVSGKITAAQERADMLGGRVKELGEQLVAVSARCEETEAKIEDLSNQADTRGGELGDLEGSAAALRGQYEAARDEHHNGELAGAQLHARLEDEKAGTIDLLRRTSQLHNEIHGLGIRRENLHGQRDRLTARCEEIDASLAGVLTERGQLQAKVADVEEVLADARNRLESSRGESSRLHESEQALQKNLSDAREHRSATHSRIGALREMQQKLEGVAAGVRQVLAAREEGRLPAVRGMLGEFLQTDVQHAPLVEAALAGADQQLIVERFADAESARQELTEVLGQSGTVELLCLDRCRPLCHDFRPADCPVPATRVIDWVRFEASLAPAMWRLLGRTFAVKTLADARFAADAAPAGSRFVTAAGEVLEADGRVRIGAANRAAGVITRRSELVELEARREQLDARIAALQQQCSDARSELTHLDEVQQKLRTAIYEANTERVECQSRLARLDEQVAALQREKPLLASDLEQIAADISAAVAAEHQAKEKAAELDRLSAERQGEVDRLNEQIAAARAHQNELSARMTEVKVSLAQAEEKTRALRETIAALNRQREQLQRDLAAGRSEIELARQRRDDAQAGIAAARQEVDTLFTEQQTLSAESEEMEETRRGLAERLEEIRTSLSQQRKARDEAAQIANARRVELGEADVRIENLISRAAEEMSMDLLEAFATYQHDETRDWAAVEEEIKELRGKIDRLGNVNLDAITEQEELEKRSEFLTAQLKDIETSRDQLNELIRRINRESTQLFLETFQAVRESFQQLFRKLFGGGKADILLTDPQDVLESGIEIVARPPGKELRSLMLLSGGEKTMTALALLFSIFRARPSPFCLLDEVDAALDEANTERFSRLLQEFDDSSQFIIISHAKRTMGMANVLYGVTMQEPGVSRRISVRFEDVEQKLGSQLEPAGA